jgi:hypothetical protein
MTRIALPNEVVEVKAFQIIVWVSVSLDASLQWDARTPKFPAILDCGNNHNFAITESHLLTWGGMHAASIPELGMIREQQQRVRLRGAGLWLHTDGEPYLLRVDEGIAVHTGDWPRLPILGLRALTNSKLQTLIYGDTKQVIIRTRPKWYWPF